MQIPDVPKSGRAAPANKGFQNWYFSCPYGDSDHIMTGKKFQYAACWKQDTELHGYIYNKKQRSLATLRKIIPNAEFVPIVGKMSKLPDYKRRLAAGTLIENGMRPNRGTHARQKPDFESGLNEEMINAQARNVYLEQQMANLEQQVGELGSAQARIVHLEQQVCELASTQARNEQEVCDRVVAVIDRLRQEFDIIFDSEYTQLQLDNGICASMVIIYLIYPPFGGGEWCCGSGRRNVAKSLKLAQFHHHPDKCDRKSDSLFISSELLKFINHMVETLDGDMVEMMAMYGK